MGLIGGSALASVFLIFVLHKDGGCALSCNTSGATKVDCDNFPSPPCLEHTSACACGGTTHTSHTNKTGGPCGGQDRIEHTPETHTNYTCEGCDHDFLTVSDPNEKCSPVTHLSNPSEHLTTHIDHISTGGHIAYVESVEEEVSGEEDAGYSARGETIEDIDTGGGEDTWCLHINKCSFHNACAHCSHTDSHSNYSTHTNIPCPSESEDCTHTSSTSHGNSHTDSESEDCTHTSSTSHGNSHTDYVA